MEWMVLHSLDFAGQTTEIRRATPSNGDNSICSPSPPQSPTRSNTSSTSILTSAVLNTSNIETEPLEEQARSSPEEETTAEPPQNGSETDSALPIDETTVPVLVEVVASASEEYSSPSESEQVLKDGNEPKDQEETSAIGDSYSLVNDISKKFYLATGAQESFVYIWDTKDGKIAHKINLKNHGKSSIPSKCSYTALTRDCSSAFLRLSITNINMQKNWCWGSRDHTLKILCPTSSLWVMGELWWLRGPEY